MRPAVDRGPTAKTIKLGRIHRYRRNDDADALHQSDHVAARSFAEVPVLAKVEGDLFDVSIAKLGIVGTRQYVGNVDFRQVDIMADDKAGLVQPLHLGLLIREVAYKGARQRTQEGRSVALIRFAQEIFRTDLHLAGELKKRGRVWGLV